jgi:uncharacterized protein YjeT (DUF2065 family)
VDTWTLILAGLGIAMVMEGIVYFITPTGVRRYLRQILEMRDATIRILGFLLMAGGLLVAYLALN